MDLTEARAMLREGKNLHFEEGKPGKRFVPSLPPRPLSCDDKRNIMVGKLFWGPIMSPREGEKLGSAAEKGRRSSYPK